MRTDMKPSVVLATLLVVLISPSAIVGAQTSTSIARPQPMTAPVTGGSGIVVTPPTGQHVVIKSILGAAYFNFSGSITVWPATLFLNMTVRSTNSTGIIFSIDYGNATEGIPGLACISPVCDYRVWK